MNNPPHSRKRLGMTMALTALALGSAHAGGYLAVNTSGQPYRWAGPVVVHLDQGPLGKLSKSQADSLALNAMDQWTSSVVGGSAVQFVRGSDLSEDHGDGQGTDPNFDPIVPDGITAVIYDQKGLLIETLGAGASQQVVGFAGPSIPETYAPAPLTEGLAVLNGRFIDGDIDGTLDGVWDIPEDQYRGAFVHEIGHMLNLDHAQAGLQYSEIGIESGTYIPGLGGGGLGKDPDYRGMPTMFPIVMPDIFSLETDDRAWIKKLYPDAASADLGSISGVVRDADGVPVNGINVIAFSADDPTTMITCVSGYTDPYPAATTGTGTFVIPSLPRGSVWIADVEPVADIFTGGSSVGPLDPPAAMPGAPEFVNETGIESNNDNGGRSTSFQIPNGSVNPNITNTEVRFNTLTDVDNVFEVSPDGGTNPATAQPITPTPGKYTLIHGFADPNEPGGTYYFGAGTFVDFYVVDYPAGLELNQIFAQGETHDVDVWVLDQQPGNTGGDFVPLTGTGGLFGPSLSLFLDYSRLGTGIGYGKFYIAAVTSDSFFGGNPGPTNYTIGLLFSASDRDNVAIKGVDGGGIDRNASSIRVLGRGFKNVGGLAPQVTVEAPGVTVNGVTYVNANTLDVSVSGLSNLTGGTAVPIQVTNQPQSGGFAGRKTETVITQSPVADWELY